MTHPLSQFKYCPKCGSERFIENNFKSKRCEDCGFIYYFNSCSSTVALIINKDDELLVTTRANDPAKGTFDLPGGFVDMYETGEEAVIREVKEETNLDVKEVKYLYSTVNIYNYSDFDVHTLDLVYSCKVDNTDNMKAADDVAELRFIKIDELNPELFGLHSVKGIIDRIKKSTI